MIQNVGQFKNTLIQNDAAGWSSSIGNNINEQFESLEKSADISSEGNKTFGDFLRDSLVKVNQVQADANLAVEKLASGESKNLHETLLSVEKAEIAFKAMSQVRNKVIEAYREMMRMQI